VFKKIIITSLILCFITGSAYGFILYKNKELYEKAREIPISAWDGKYQNNKINNKYKIAVLTETGGEWQSAYYIQEAAKKIGWEARVYFKTFLSREDELRNFQPDFILVVSPESELTISPEFAHVKKYLFYTSALEKAFKMESVYLNLLDKKYRKKFIQYDGFLITPKEIEIFKRAIEGIGKKFEGINAYPTAYIIDKKYEAPNKIFYSGFNSGRLRASKKYKQVFNSLVDEGIISFYGPKTVWGNFGKNWNGMLPKDQLLSSINSHGVALVFHSKKHIDSRIPSARVFEAASAKAVIICDKNKFVEDNFGDSVLYIDNTKSAEEMEQQISDHYKWILNNPKEAEKLAMKSHAIFVEKFALEKDLIRIAKMHEGVLKEDAR
jgi:hypothetical protein